MATVVTKEGEVRFARSFLHALHANENNGYLLLAVIAWMRAESGQRYIGYNPFNLRPGKDIAQWQVGIRKGPVGYFAVFRNLSEAAMATAARLMRAGWDYRGYGPVVAAAGRSAGTDAQQVVQATDFLTAIAMSKWSSDHYGAADGDKTTNRLIKLWAQLTGHPIPSKWFVDTVKPKPRPRPRPRPRQKQATVHPIEEPAYIEGYAAENFYEERPHYGDYVLGSGLTGVD